MLLTTTKLVRHDLERLEMEFDRCARTYPPLFHERVSAWSENGYELLTESQWRTFTLINPEPMPLLRFGWWCWNGPWTISEDEELMGRFTGYREGLDEFLDLSNTTSTLIAEFVPEVIQGVGGYDSWLHLIHRMALLYPSMLLEVEQDFWNLGANDTRTWEARTADWHVVDGVGIPRHPVVHRLKFNVFTSSSALLRMILNPESVRTWEDPVEGFPVNIVWDHDAEVQEDLSSTEKLTSEASPPAPNLWRRKGDIYEVWFESGPGMEPIPVARHLGCDHINRLIEHAGKGVHVFQFLSSSKDRSIHPVASTILEDEMDELSDEEERKGYQFGTPGDETLDDEALASLKASIEEARHREEVARLAGDDERAEEESTTRRKLERQLRHDTNHRGRPRRLGTLEEEKARKAVCNALADQYRRLKEKGLGRLADHFKVSIKWIPQVRCYAYLPTTPITWQTATGSYLAKGLL